MVYAQDCSVSPTCRRRCYVERKVLKVILREREREREIGREIEREREKLRMKIILNCIQAFMMAIDMH